MVKLGAPSSNKLRAIEDIDDEVREISPKDMKELTAPDLFDGEDESDESDEN